jgi:hypothetical protein
VSGVHAGAAVRARDRVVQASAGDANASNGSSEVAHRRGARVRGGIPRGIDDAPAKAVRASPEDDTGGLDRDVRVAPEFVGDDTADVEVERLLRRSAVVAKDARLRAGHGGVERTLCGHDADDAAPHLRHELGRARRGHRTRIVGAPIRAARRAFRARTICIASAVVGRGRSVVAAEERAARCEQRRERQGERGRREPPHRQLDNLCAHMLIDKAGRQTKRNRRAPRGVRRSSSTTRRVVDAAS